MQQSTHNQSYFREPTAEEISDVKAYLAQHDYDGDMQMAGMIFDPAYKVVFPDYVTGGPGFCGKVLIVLYDGGPGQLESFTWDQENRVAREQPET